MAKQVVVDDATKEQFTQCMCFCTILVSDFKAQCKVIHPKYYSRVHISSNEVFSKIMKKPSIVQK